MNFIMINSISLDMMNYPAASSGVSIELSAYLLRSKDKNNAGTVLKTTQNGFTIQTTEQKVDFIINASFQGNDLVGNYKATYKGRMLRAVSFKAKKIADM